MIYKGSFNFDGRNHPGECEVDDNNNIYLTINESNINEYKQKITGIANSDSLVLYGCRLIGHGVGYYKYMVEYMVNRHINIKLKNVDFNKHIQNFRFTFEPLDEWLGFKTIIKDDTTIKFDIPEDIVLYDKNGLEIKIKYYKEGDESILENQIKNIKVIPYICVNSNKVITVYKISNYIQMITRFFALLMGYCGKVKEIKFIKMYKGKKILGDFEDELIINIDFSNCYYNRIGYPVHNLRTYFSSLTDDIKVMFETWYDLYFNKKHKEAILVYYSPYNSHTLGDKFLNIAKCLEKISIAKEDSKEKQKKNKMLHKVLDDFYKEYKEDLVKRLKKSEFKKKYINNIEEIHEEIANSIVYKYDMRIDLAKRIKDIDKKNQLKLKFDEKHFTKIKDSYTVYDYMANTRNYYTHLDKSEYIIKDIYMPCYCRIMEKLFINELLNCIITDKKYIDERLIRDQYLTIYDNRDC